MKKNKRYVTLIFESNDKESELDLLCFRSRFCRNRDIRAGKLVKILYDDTVEELLKYKNYEDACQHTRHVASGRFVSHGMMDKLPKDIMAFEEFMKRFPTTFCSD